MEDLRDSVEVMAMRLVDAGYVKGFVRSSDDGQEKLLVILKQNGAAFPMERLRRPPLPFT